MDISKSAPLTSWQKKAWCSLKGSTTLAMPFTFLAFGFRLEVLALSTKCFNVIFNYSRHYTIRQAYKEWMTCLCMQGLSQVSNPLLQEGPSKKCLGKPWEMKCQCKSPLDCRKCCTIRRNSGSISSRVEFENYCIISHIKLHSHAYIIQYSLTQEGKLGHMRSSWIWGQCLIRLCGLLPRFLAAKAGTVHFSY